MTTHLSFWKHPLDLEPPIQTADASNSIYLISFQTTKFQVVQEKENLPIMHHAWLPT